MEIRSISMDGRKHSNPSFLIAPNGSLWLSVPIGLQRVEFNAHRVFDPHTILDFGTENGLYLNNFFLSDRFWNRTVNQYSTRFQTTWMQAVWAWYFLFLNHFKLIF